MIFAITFCLISFMVVMGIIKVLALLFTIPFTMCSFILKVVFGMLAAIVATVILFGYIGLIAGIILLPIVGLFLCWNKRVKE